MTSVCLIVQNDYAVDVRVRRKAEALVAAGYSVDVLALRSGTSPKRYTLNGVRVFTIALGKKRGSRWRYVFEYAAFFLWASTSVALRMARRRYAVVDVNTLPDVLVFAAAPARWMGATVVLDMHEITPEFYASKYGIATRARVVRLLRRIERMSFDFADHVITISEPIRDLLAARGLPRGKSTVIVNAVDETAFAAGIPRTGVAAAAEGRFVLMYHGTLTRVYGLELAIDAFARAQEEMPGAELWVLGQGPERDALERRAGQRGVASRVRFHRAVPHAEVAAWVSRCDAGVLPLRRDAFLEFAFPNKLSEYIVMGRPVLMPRLTTMRHYFSETALAYFEPDDAADLARQMVRLYRDGALRERLAARAREEYAPIRWDVMKQRYLGLMDALTRPRPGAAGRREGAASWTR